MPTAYEVRKGDTLWSVAMMHGCSFKVLAEANKEMVSNPKRLRVGQVLLIPHCAGERRHVSKNSAPLNCRWDASDIDSKTLKKKMKERGFRPPRGFRALVVKTTLRPGGGAIESHKLYDYGGKSTRRRGWNPASTVKLYSGVAAMERILALGFSPEVEVTFHYRRGDRTFSLAELFEEAMHWSKNQAHNRLVQLAGFDRLNGPRGTLKRLGLDESFIMRAYGPTRWRSEGHPLSLRKTPRITLKEGTKTKVLPVHSGARDYPCGSAACTTLSELSRFMCSLMLHEQLPSARRLELGGNSQGEHLRFIRRKLNRKRDRKKDPVWRVFEEAFVPEEQRGEARRGAYQIFRKSGYSMEWASDMLYIYLPRTRTRWSVTMAGHSGRYCLKNAARVLSELIVSGEL